MEVEMKIRGLMMDPSTNLPIVVLKDVNGVIDHVLNQLSPDRAMSGTAFQTLDSSLGQTATAARSRNMRTAKK